MIAYYSDYSSSSPGYIKKSDRAGARDKHGCLLLKLAWNTRDVRWACFKSLQIHFTFWGSGLVQLVEQMLPIPEVRSSNPVIGNISY